MNALESWLVNLTGETYLWIGELFLIVFAALLAGYLLNKLFNRLQLKAATANMMQVWEQFLSHSRKFEDAVLFQQPFPELDSENFYIKMHQINVLF